MSAIYSFYIGLDIDGVFCPDRFKPPLDEMTAKKVEKKFPEGRGRYTPLQWKQAAACFLNAETLRIFNISVVGRIEAFIRKHELPVSLGIIITSNWRNAATLDELKTFVFNKTGFADKIVAKTPQDVIGAAKVARHILFAQTMEEQQNPVAGYIALDDNEFNKKIHFPEEMEEFVKVDGEKLLTTEDADRAYVKAKMQIKRTFGIKSIKDQS